MPAYLTQADCEAAIPGLLVQDPARFAELMATAERDVEALFPLGDPDGTGARIDRAGWDAWETAALKRAMVAQVEWLVVTPRSRRVGVAAPAQVTSVKGPDFTKTFAPVSTAKPSRYGALLRDELAPLVHRRVMSGRAVA